MSSSFNSLPPVCFCLNCWVYMGEHNPRQLCGKYDCINIDLDYDSDIDIKNVRKSGLKNSPYYDPEAYGYDKTFHGYLKHFDEIKVYLES